MLLAVLNALLSIHHIGGLQVRWLLFFDRGKPTILVKEVMATIINQNDEVQLFHTDQLTLRSLSADSNNSIEQKGWAINPSVPAS